MLTAFSICQTWDSMVPSCMCISPMEECSQPLTVNACSPSLNEHTSNFLRCLPVPPPPLISTSTAFHNHIINLWRRVNSWKSTFPKCWTKAACVLPQMSSALRQKAELFLCLGLCLGHCRGSWRVQQMTLVWIILFMLSGQIDSSTKTNYLEGCTG